MRYTAFLTALLWAQSPLPDSLHALFEKDFQFDVVVARTFALQSTSTDTFPLSPFLSGHMRVGIAWHWYLRGKWAISVQPGFAWYRQVFRATSASKVPQAELMPEGYRWLKYRLGAVSLQTGLRFSDRRAGQLFPRYWVEVGGWVQRRMGSSLKYVALRGETLERTRWEGSTPLSLWQGGPYFALGRQWLGLHACYHGLPLYVPGTAVASAAPRWEVGFLVAL